MVREISVTGQCVRGPGWKQPEGNA